MKSLPPSDLTVRAALGLRTGDKGVVSFMFLRTRQVEGKSLGMDHTAGGGGEG